MPPNAKMILAKSVSKDQECHWILAKKDGLADQVQNEKKIRKKFKLPQSLFELLVQRGYREENDITRFLRPRLADLRNPFEIKNMEKAVERVHIAIENKEKILVFGDYDVDGVTSVTILTRLLLAYGTRVSNYLPHRLSDGYGLSKRALKSAFKLSGKPDLLIAIDCGSTAVEQCRWLKEENVEVIIIDHHELSGDGAPVCHAFVDPKAHNQHLYSDLCAAGLAFKFAHAMLIKKPLEDFELKKCLDLVALGTIADIVPLNEENRLLVYFGLKYLAHTESLGLRSLMHVARVKAPLNPGDVGFKLGPRINAAGRVDSANSALELLLGNDAIRVQRLAQELDQHNRKRQFIELKTLEEAQEQMEIYQKKTKPFAYTLASEKWHPGVVGIVASRVSREKYRPCFVIAIDKKGVGKGSGRSIEGVSLVKAISDCRDLLIDGGGHHMAAGISIEKEKIPEFSEAFNNNVNEQLSGKEPVPTINIDCQINLEEINEFYLRALEKFEPFGNGNPAPLFFAKKVYPYLTPRLLQDKHLKLSLCSHDPNSADTDIDALTRSRIDAIYFNFGAKAAPSPPWDIAFHLERNTFNGASNPQLILKGLLQS